MEKFLGQWMPVLASEHGRTIDRLIIWTHWLMLVLFVVWGAYFLYVLWRFNAKRSPRANYHGAQTHVSTYAEAGVALVEVILLVGFSIPAWYRWTQRPAKEKNPLEIRVVAEQFAWNVHYPGADGVFGRRKVELVTSSNPLGLDLTDPAAKDDIVTLNQLHLELDRDTVITVSSKDVIHSFKLPVMRAEQDAIPGLPVQIHFKPILANDDGTKWEIACAQLCGLGHYRMRGDMHVHKKADFEKWLVTEPKAATSIGSGT
jgi:cytochrome c oxidase subunit 2